ncbi:hypothetical protein COCSUDRAFT_43516 [Coccomyxa subellipsoidea C-169]|uniref:Glycosyl transferase CAP10 domain-containing protein n=1 Tax=Coccomyxa subellipsoidea (strain C-169) TaxID=574566 RepID=I0YS25_COCSC|nr:hypothetical protein COCSUDRAFT_43516 [Coccomyxa subellipsoidea C-169]EIE21194.1 hypothetical protein COCSUDRAFT_43516 [Coccomyxa subellipsoidea C-169]|eukprot:XP_005645738.1 hypothetical protein COCSUDRAFT_43516 [Coccomyxa subellipsoidea C-169]
MHWIALLLPLLLLAHRGQAVDLPSSAEYLRRHCAAHRAVYEPLIDGYLSQFRDGFTVAQLLTLPSVYNGTRMQREFSGGMPLLYIIDGELRVDASLPKPGNKRLKNLEYFGMPVLEQLTRRARLPDLALLYSPFDEPTEFPGVDAAPWFGYCTVPQQQRTLMLPDTLAPADLQCPAGGCQAGPGDAREPRAVFLGSPTGWHKGKRRAVHSGLTEDPDRLLSPEEREVFRPVQFMELPEQVQRFKYLVNVEGNCAALRLRRLLASPSAVMFVQSDEIEWYYPLLKPYVHYIPVRFSAAGLPEGGLGQVDLAEKVAWAEENPQRVAAIVREANAFARKYLSRQGQECYAMQMLDAFARLLRDPWNVRRVRHRTRPYPGVHTD